MTQHDLDRQVALATGESLCDICRRGFSLADPLDVCFDPEPYDMPPQVVNWDQLDFDRHSEPLSPLHPHSDRLTSHA